MKKYSKKVIEQFMSTYNYIPIANLEDLQNMKHSMRYTFAKGTEYEGVYEGGLNKSYIQVRDIDMSGKDNFIPIGDEHTPFIGTYDGGNFIISSLNINRSSSSYSGLFASISKASLDNVKIVNSSVHGSAFVGGLSSKAKNSIIRNCSYDGKVNGALNIGSVIGEAHDCLIENISGYGEVSSPAYSSNVGGLIGRCISTKISLSTSNSTVLSKGENVGGLIGHSSLIELIDCSFHGYKISGVNNVGALIGQSNNSKIVLSISRTTIEVDCIERALIGKSVRDEVRDSYFIKI